jgi:uncharacterized repeat protein (TIGR03803 family)
MHDVNCLPVGKLVLSKVFCIIFVFCAATVIASSGQVLTTVVNFDGSNGTSPLAPLVRATDGNFHGTTAFGGAGAGTVFKLTPDGTLTTLHTFDNSDGAYPGRIVQATDGNFYGTTGRNGTGGEGTVFKITPSGTLTTLHNFCLQMNCPDGASPFGGIVQATDGNFYGTTYTGGLGGLDGYGTVFKITPAGTLTTLYNFCSQPNCADGSFPDGALVQATDGNFYGTTAEGGTISTCGGVGCGTVFRITASGTLTTLHGFVGYPTEGTDPSAGLVQATDGNFYGTTYSGGPSNNCPPYFHGCGKVFTITPSGTVTTLHSFGGSPADGSNPVAVLVQATDGNFYGTTSTGGTSPCDMGGCGTVFKVTPARAYDTAELRPD